METSKEIAHTIIHTDTLRTKVKLEALITEREAMIWENQQAITQQISIPYSEKAFLKIKEEMLKLLEEIWEKKKY